jgi:hypothetical protein
MKVSNDYPAASPSNNNETTSVSMSFLKIVSGISHLIISIY